ncbi:metalloregulator ArsR/SmtB family transcription factor [Compostibacter hankyongensis]|uniref:HTH arsR-type domain-containing protein n=1 Tax=Compostibacter hankyongensis TaxID=1007089 RepID=A0ABP8FDS1_9BACT
MEKTLVPTSSNALVINRGNGEKDLIRLDYVAVRKAAMVLRAINHKLRQQIIKLLEDHKKMTVTEIYVKLRLEQSVASQHLAILRRAGIVITERDGKFIFYSINAQRVAEVAHFVEELVG